MEPEIDLFDEFKMAKVVRKRPLKTPHDKFSWTQQEDLILIRLVKAYGENAWHRMLKMLPKKSEIKCM